ncbi:PREDICTED: adenosine kinase-like isoform X2 [Priapulus caudatus]|uniref:Adenosine kinase n=1 Tax=Priapulus caudatus TaxID=37621 RepID=A0ABM1EJG7_PRICU|nr:PREDICTED: adenosine kinase-like isoform X2 [Priapulus caudatus]
MEKQVEGEGMLLGMGNPLLDVAAVVTKEFLDKYELLPDNAILADAKHKDIFEDMHQFTEVEFTPGGATQNTLRTAQWMTGSPEFATLFFGCIAKDRHGDIMTKAMKEGSVKTVYQINGSNSEPTGTCAVCITGNNRSLVANLASANCFTKAHLDDKANWAHVERAKLVYTAEAEAFSEAQGFGTKDVKEIALKAASLPKHNSKRSRTVVITQGAEPTIIVEGGKLTEYAIIPIEKEKIVDTNGAGDAFVGGYLSQLMLERSTEQCVRAANYVANLIIQRHGCTFTEKCVYE